MQAAFEQQIEHFKVRMIDVQTEVNNMQIKLDKND